MAYNLRAESDCDYIALFTSGRYTNCRVGDFTRTVSPQSGSTDINGRMQIFTAYNATTDAACECGHVTLTSGAAGAGTPGNEYDNGVYASRGGIVYLEATVRCAKSVTVRAGNGGQGGAGLDAPAGEYGLYRPTAYGYWYFNSGKGGGSGGAGGSSEARCTAAYCGKVTVTSGRAGDGGIAGNGANCPGGYLSDAMIEESNQGICYGGTGGNGGTSGQGGTSTAYASASDCDDVTVTAGDGGDAPDGGEGGECSGKRVGSLGWYTGGGGAIYGGTVNYAGNSIATCSASRCGNVSASAGNGGNMGNGGKGQDAKPVYYDDGDTYERDSCGSGGGLSKTYGQPGWSGYSQLTLSATSCRSVTARTGNGGDAGDGGDTGSGYANYSSNGGKAGDSVNGGKVIAQITVNGSVVFETLGNVNVTMGNPGQGGKGGKAHGSPMAVDGEDGGPGLEVVTSANVMRSVLHGQRLGSYSIPTPNNEDSTVNGFPGHPDGTGKGAAWFGGAPGPYASSQYGGNGAPLPGLESLGSGRDGNGVYLGDFWENGTSP